MLIDYHLHNHFSPDSEADTRDILKAEKERGISHVCFTNHAEWFEHGAAVPGVFDLYEAERRFETIEWELNTIREEFPDMDIRIGTELQYQEQYMDDLTKFVEQTPLDFILGSIHIIDGVIISSHLKADDIYTKISEEEAWTKYFEDMHKLLDWGHIDVLAHFDIVKKYGHKHYGKFEPEKHKALIMTVLQKAKNKGVGLELNTGSLHSRCKEIFPHPTILKWALDIGIEHFTLSSDAHRADIAGKFIPDALAIAKDVGIKEISTYEKRKPTKHSIQ